MKVSGFTKKLGSILILLALIIYLIPIKVLATSPYIANDQIIKVFFPLQAGFAEIDQNGKYSGYTYEYLMKIAQLTGWRYEFIPVEATNENLVEGLDKVSRGEFQLSGAMNYDAQLAQKYEYSISYGETNYAIVANKNNIKLNPRTLFDYENLKVALIENAKGQNGIFDEFCQQNGLKYQPVYAQNNSECRQLIEDGLADIMISKDVSKNIDLKIITIFSPKPFYFAASKGNTQLIQQLNEALIAIDVADPNFTTNLHEKYFSKSSEEMSLTKDEAEYLENAPVIRVLIPGNRAPIQSYDKQTNTFSGIIIDILQKISQISGLQFEFIPVDYEQQLNQYLSDGNFDIVAGISYFYNQNTMPQTSSRLLLTSPIFSSPIIRISNNSNSSKHSQILVSRSIREFDSQENISYHQDIQEIFQLVNSGEYSEAYVNGYIAQHMIEKKQYNNISLSYTPYGNYDLCLGVSRKCDLRLINILNQTIANLEKSQIEDIVYKNTTHFTPNNLWDIIKIDPAQIIMPALIIAIIILSLLSLLFVKTKRLNKLIAKEKNEYKAIAQTDRLAQTYNNAAFKQLASAYLNQEKITPYGALIVCDIDNFKNINDTYGHLKGDEVISKLGEILTTIFRGEDIVGRLGGDEFVVMLKNVASFDTIEKRCQELQEKSTLILAESPITLSIGIAVFSGNTPFDTLFKQADAALYQVKNAGKNGYIINAESKTNYGKTN